MGPVVKRLMTAQAFRRVTSASLAGSRCSAIGIEGAGVLEELLGGERTGRALERRGGRASGTLAGMPLHPTIEALHQGMRQNPDSREMHELTPEEGRAAYRALGQAFGPGPDLARVEDRAAPGPAGDIPLRVYAPQSEGPLPVLVYYHGGGFVIGDLESHDRPCRELCKAAGCLLVAVDYRLAPEHPFPAAVEDSLAALHWIADNAAALGGDPKRLAVGGDSAGGNLAAVMALLARDGGPALRLQLLVYPTVDRRIERYPSTEENAEAPFLGKVTMEWFMGHYLGTAEVTEAHLDPRVSPLLADSHAGLPPALTLTAGFDPLRDQGTAYHEALTGAGVDSTLHAFDNMPHAFFQLSGLVEEGKQAIAESAAALRAAFAD